MEQSKAKGTSSMIRPIGYGGDAVNENGAAPTTSSPPLLLVVNPTRCTMTKSHRQNADQARNTAGTHRHLKVMATMFHGTCCGVGG